MGIDVTDGMKRVLEFVSAEPGIRVTRLSKLVWPHKKRDGKAGWYGYHEIEECMVAGLVERVAVNSGQVEFYLTFAGTRHIER